jgi:hypothetical protein
MLLLSVAPVWPTSLARPSLRPDALSPLPLRSLLRAHNTRRYDHPLAGGPGLSGWGYAGFHASVNFRFTEFSWKFDDTPAGLGLHVRGGSKSSMGLPAGSSSRICLPPNPLTM